MIVTQYVLSSSRHLVTPLIYIHFCVWLGLFVDRWWLKEVWYAPDFLSNCSTCVPVTAPGITRSPSKRTCRGTLSQKTRNWPTCEPVHVPWCTWTQPGEVEELRSGLLCRQLDSVGVLLRKQDVLMLTFMVNFVALSPHSQRSTYRDAHAVPSSSIVDLALRCQAAKERTRSLKFVCQKEQRRGKWLVPCVQALTLCNICKFIFKSSCQFPVACRRLLRGADCSACTYDRSGPRFADPASISTISEPRKTTKRW